jgi:hypothetical protein
MWPAKERRKDKMEYTIQVNKAELIDKTIDNHLNQQMATGNRREWQIHILDGDNAKIVLHQDGNYYDSNAEVYILSLDELFDEGAIDDMPSFSDDYSESREEFMKDHDLESMDDLNEDMQKEYDDLLEAYKKNTMDFAKSTLSAGRKEKVSSENAEGYIIATYKIEYV